MLLRRASSEAQAAALLRAARPGRPVLASPCMHPRTAMVRSLGMRAPLLTPARRCMSSGSAPASASGAVSSACPGGQAAAPSTEHALPRHSSRFRYAALLGGGVALVLATAALTSSSSAVVHAEEARRPQTPGWLRDRLCEAAAAGDLARLQSLLQKHPPPEGINVTHRFGWSPLHAAVANGRTEVVKFILSRPEVDVNLPDTYTPRSNDLNAMMMKQAARQAAFEELNPSLPGGGFTALHYAALLAPMNIVQMLLDAGADMDLRAHGYTPDKLVDLTALNDTREGSGNDKEAQARRARLEQVASAIGAARQKRAVERARKEKEERLKFPLELKLAQLMVAQEVPILSVSAAMRRRDNGWFDPTKPLVFLFLGSSGVGKTMLAKLLAQHVVKDPDAFIRIDCSEYQSKHEMARLIGSPPGYVGHEEGGQLTTKLAKCPNAVVLLDEIEKAHPDVLSLLLAVFDEGRLTDGKGSTIVCPQAIFVMTSNLVQDEIRDALENGYLLRPPVSILTPERVAQSTAQLRQLGGITSTPMQATSAQMEEAAKSAAPIAPEEHAAAIAPVHAPVGDASSSTTTTILPGAYPVVPVESSMVAPSSAPTSASSSSTPSPDALSRSMAKLAADTERFLRFVVHPVLKRAFKRDEFIGRINDMVIFHPFSQRDLQQTVETELKRWAERARERHQIELAWTPQLVDSLTHNYDERYGYRSLMYGVEKRVVNVLASAHERDRISAGCRVLLDVEAPQALPGGLGPAAGHASASAPVVIREVTTPTPSESSEHGRKKFLGLF